jgi:hypothetical protein
MFVLSSCKENILDWLELVATTFIEVYDFDHNEWVLHDLHTASYVNKQCMWLLYHVLGIEDNDPQVQKAVAEMQPLSHEVKALPPLAPLPDATVSCPNIRSLS